MRTAFIDTLIEEAMVNRNIYLITPDLGFSVLERFQELFPERFLNVGIAEQNAIGVAAGLALSGKVVYVYSIVPFVTMRCFEQVRVNLAYMELNVRLVGVGGGLSYGPAGSTHHSIEDIAIMRALPNMTVCCPGDPVEAKEIVKQSIEYHGPMYIRLGKNGEPIIHEDSKIQIGKVNVLKQGKKFLLFVTGNLLEMAFNVKNKLKEKKIEITLVSVSTIKPLDEVEILKLLVQHSHVYTLEEHNVIGGLGSAISELIAEKGINLCKFKRLGIQDMYLHDVGSQSFLRDRINLTEEEIIKVMIEQSK